MTKAFSCMYLHMYRYMGIESSTCELYFLIWVNCTQVHAHLHLQFLWKHLRTTVLAKGIMYNCTCALVRVCCTHVHVHEQSRA